MKRFISVIMLLCMLVSLFTVSAYADNFLVNDPADFARVLLEEVKDYDNIKLDAGVYTMPKSVSAQHLTITGAGESATLIKFPSGYEENSTLSFSGATLDKSALGSGSGSGSSGGSGSGSGGAPKFKSIKSGGNVAELNGVGYPSIQAAVEAAKPGDTVKVIASHALDMSAGTVLPDGGYVLVKVDKKLTIDLNGCDVSVDAAALPSSYSMLRSVIATDSTGDLLLMDSSGGNGSLTIDANGAEIYSLVYNYGGKLEISSGYYSAKGFDLAAGRGMICSTNTETFITGGTYIVDQVGEGANGSPWICNASGQSRLWINVSGGTFNENFPETLAKFYVFETRIAPDKTLINNGNGTWSVVDGEASVTETLYSHGNNDIIINVFENLEDAADSTVEKDTIRINLSGNAKIDREVKTHKPIYVYDGKDISLDLNGNNVTGVGSELDCLFDFGPDSKLTVNGEGIISNPKGSIFSSTPNKNQLVINGGTWCGFDPTNYLKPGAKVEKQPDGTYKVIPAPESAPAAPAANTYAVPATADNSNMPLWSCLFVLFAVTAILSGKKRRS